jgi:hypothetical protein
MLIRHIRTQSAEAPKVRHDFVTHLNTVPNRTDITGNQENKFVHSAACMLQCVKLWVPEFRGRGLMGWQQLTHRTKTEIVGDLLSAAFADRTP